MRAKPSSGFVLTVVCLLLSGCGAGDGPGEEQAASAMAVTLTEAKTQPLARAVSVSGPVSAYEEMQLGVELSGQRVTALNVDVGQQVKAGQVLLQLDHRTLDSELAQAEASMRQAQASLELARAQRERGEKLSAGQLISLGDLDELRAAHTQAQAQLEIGR
ncbi:MAG TPA: efflux RND transporter periplasmic adaptor subunit, partial [Xanthomonadaceae bacterium]|nr:efflux RND transporter periplasmic adaptor subunit [Xanthomonadaceae bacterium]